MQLRGQAKAIRDKADASERLAALEQRASNDPFAGADRAVKEYLADAQRAGDATYNALSTSIKGLEDLAVTALSGGDAKSAAKAWVNGLLSEFLRLQVVKPMLRDLFGGGGGGNNYGALIKGVVGLFGSNMYSGGGWGTDGPRLTGQQLMGISAVGPNDVYAVGVGGIVLHRY